jgi:glutathione S-transferase
MASSTSAAAAAAALPRLFIGQANYSSWSMRPWLALRAANFAFTEERVEVEGGGVNAKHLAYSPSGLVPCLHLPDGSRVWDSVGIFEWLAERAPAGSVWPADPAARAYARCITLEMHAGFGDLRAGLPCNFKMRLVGYEALPERVAANVARVAGIWAEARATYGAPSGEGPFLFGRFTAADAMYAPVVSRFISYNVDLAAWPAAAAYAAAVAAHPLYREWEAAALAETNPIAHYDEAALRLGRGRRAGLCAIEEAAARLVAAKQ